MKVKYDFMNHGIDGTVSLQVGTKTIQVAEGERISVVVEPAFYRPDAKSSLAFVTVETEKKGPISREVHTLAGATGRIDRVSRMKSVVPQADLKEKDDETPDPPETEESEGDEAEE